MAVRSEAHGKKVNHAPTRKRLLIAAFILVAAILWVLFKIIVNGLLIFDKSDQIAQLEERLAKEQAVYDSLQQKSRQLDHPAYIEKMAREQLDMVRMGEQKFNTPE